MIQLEGNYIIYIVGIILLCFVLYKSFNLLLKVSFFIVITAFLAYQYTHGIL